MPKPGLFHTLNDERYWPIVWIDKASTQVANLRIVHLHFLLFSGLIVEPLGIPHVLCRLPCLRYTNLLPGCGVCHAIEPAGGEVVPPCAGTWHHHWQGRDEVGVLGAQTIWFGAKALRGRNNRRRNGREEWGAERVAMAVMHLPSSEPGDHRRHWCCADKFQERRLQENPRRCMQEGGGVAEPVRPMLQR